VQRTALFRANSQRCGRADESDKLFDMGVVIKSKLVLVFQ
jgi:hypothetical protein